MAYYVTLEEAKNQLRVDFDDDDVVIYNIIGAAQNSILNEIKAHQQGLGTVETDGTTALIGSDTTSSSTRFLDYNAGDIIKVDGETERTIATITDDQNLTVTVAFTNSESGLNYTIESSPLEGGVLPLSLKQAILLMIGHLYENREAAMIGVSITKIPYGIEYLVAPYKSWVVK